jgi:hypothetical protein
LAGYPGGDGQPSGQSRVGMIHMLCQNKNPSKKHTFLLCRG